MFEWKCEHCGKKFYSSCPERNRKFVECCNCGKDVVNPFYDPSEPERN